MAQQQVLEHEVVVWASPRNNGREEQPEEFEHALSIADFHACEVLPPHNLSAAVRQRSKAELLEITTATLRALHPEPGYRIPCPVLIMRGEHDRAGAIRQQAPVWARRDAAEYAILPDAGHLSNMDNPLVFNQRVMEFLERVVA